MHLSRGDVVMVDFPFGEGLGSKFRPAVVVQCDSYNRRLDSVVVAMITKNTALVGRETRHVLIDISTADGQQTGLWMNSVVNCSQLASIKISRVSKQLGQLSETGLAQVSAALRAGLGL